MGWGDSPHVRERFRKGASFRDLDDCRRQAERWCPEIAGLRVHGTTRRLPREVFEAEEQQALQPYDGVVYDVPQWKEVTVHPDHQVSFGGSVRTQGCNVTVTKLVSPFVTRRSPS